LLPPPHLRRSALFPYTTLFRSVAGDDTVLERVLDAGIHARDVLARDAATGDLVLELVQLALGRVERLEGDLDLRELAGATGLLLDRKSTRLNSSHVKISYAVFC